MCVEEYIRSEIYNHMEKYKIMVSKSDIEEMVEETMKGTYAFQIIYNDLVDDSKEARMLNYSFYSFIGIDYRKIVFRDEDETFYAKYSYDGGKRFQWSEIETLILNPSIIREMKLNKIIK